MSEDYEDGSNIPQSVIKRAENESDISIAIGTLVKGALEMAKEHDEFPDNSSSS